MYVFVYLRAKSSLYTLSDTGGHEVRVGKLYGGRQRDEVQSM